MCKKYRQGDCPTRSRKDSPGSKDRKALKKIGKASKETRKRRRRQAKRGDKGMQGGVQRQARGAIRQASGRKKTGKEVQKDRQGGANNIRQGVQEIQAMGCENTALI
jgi:hypothetical protein